MAETPAEPTAPTPPTPPKQVRVDWKSLHLWQIQWVRDVLVILGIVGLLWLGQKISIVTVPLLLALLLAYLFEPAIVWMMKRLGMSRPGAVAAIIVGAIALIGIPFTLGASYAVLQLAAAVDSVVSHANVIQQAVDLTDKLDADGAAGAPDASAEAAEAGALAPNTGEDLAEAQSEALHTLDESDSQTDGATEQPGLVARALAGLNRFLYPPSKSARPEVEKLFDDFQAERVRAGKEAPGDAFSPFWRSIYHHVRESRDEDSSVGGALGAAIAWVDANREQVAVTLANFGAQVVNRALQLAGAALGIGFMVFVTMFFFFFVATEWVKLQGWGVRILPKRNRGRIVYLLGRFDQVISGFIRGRLTIAFLQSIVFSLSYFVIGVPGAFLLGPIVALLSIVPYLALVGLPVSITLLAAGDHDGFRAAWWWILGAPTAVYFVGQALDDYVWTPLIQGRSTGMDTPTILFASLAGGSLFGVFGLLIAIPIAACLKILIQEVFWPRFKAWGEGREEDFLPISRE